jgi:type VI secretion system protein
MEISGNTVLITGGATGIGYAMAEAFLKARNEVIICGRREERLLERIRTWEKEPTRRSREDPRRITDSVLRHLRRLLNTKEGNVPIAEDYGVPDFTDLLYSYPESVKEIERTIRLAIQKYEPRLRGAKVSFVPQEEDLLSLRFQIVARLDTESKTQVFFETQIDSDGKVTIKG